MPLLTLADELSFGDLGSKGRGRCRYTSRDSGSSAEMISQLSPRSEVRAAVVVVEVEGEDRMSFHSNNKRRS
jgi:hypothetical protein